MTYARVRQKLDAGQTIVLDGAIGTELLRREVTWADHQLGQRPDIVRGIHASYIAAGADVISTNTFQLSRRSFVQHFNNAEHLRHIGSHDIETRWADLITAGVRLAMEAREQAGKQQEVAVAGAMTTLEWCFRPDLAPPMDVAELKHRLDADLTEKRTTEADFDAYARDTSLGLVALEVLAAVYPCSDEEKGAPQ